MEFNPNKTPVEIIKEGASVGTYFRDTYSGDNGKWCSNSSKKFDELKNSYQKYYFSDYCDIKLHKYKVKTGTSLSFWKNKGWVNKINPCGWFQSYLDTF